LLQPKLHAVQRIAAVGRIKEDESKIGIVQEQCMRQPVIGLSRQIPQNRFTFGAVLSARTKFVNHPELLTVRGGVFFEFAVRQPPAQPRLAHTRVAYQHDLGRGVMYCLLQCFTKQYIEIPLP
jgi:hypothetical protein